MQVHNDFDLSQILWYKIGGKARYLLDCRNEHDVLEALDFVDKNNPQRLFFLGLGSNLIFTDEYFDGAVIRVVNDSNSLIRRDSDGFVECFSGEVLDNLILYTFEQKLSGLEWAGGLPGTVGAGVRGNVGAFGGEIKDSVVSAYVAEFEKGRLDTKILSNEDLQFSYRTSVVKLAKNMIVLSARFNLTETDENGISAAQDVYEGNKKYRRDRHPLEYPNCGSVFKNIAKPDDVEKVLSVMPEITEKSKTDWHGKVSMGYLINVLGFAGHRVGNAQVSEKHNNFIVNLGDAKSADVKKIISDIQDKFDEKFGFRPEVEVEIVE